MLENIELHKDNKRKFKMIAADYTTTMKALIMEEARFVMDEDLDVPSSDRESEQDRISVIIDIPADFKNEVKMFTYNNNLRIRDLWVFCVDRIIEREWQDDWDEQGYIL